ncbi:MAG: hypothetical protein ABW352_17430 [Polyangiales bacterium]
MRFAVLLACLLAFIPSAHAQSLPVVAHTQGPRLEPRDPALQLQVDRSLFRAQRRDRIMLSVGLGLLTSAALHTLVLTARDRCNNNGNASLVGAGITGGVGFSLALGSGIALARNTRTVRYPMTTGQKFAVIFSGVGAAVAAQTLLVGTWMVQGAGACSS